MNRHLQNPGRCLAVCVLVLLAASVAAPAQAQVVETEPDPVRQDQPVTVFFNAAGTALEGYDGPVYAYTGISTEDDDWICTPADFGDNSTVPLTERVEAGRYRLEIDDIAAFYREVGESCPLEDGERIVTLNFVFRTESADRQSEDLFVDVLPPVSGEPSVEVSVGAPADVQPLYPAFVQDGETLRLEADAVTGGGAELESFRLMVDGEERASTEADTLRLDLALGAAGAHEVTLVARTTGGLEDRKTFEAFQVAAVEEAPLPAGLEDGINYTSSTSAMLVLRAPHKEFVFVVGDVPGWDANNDYLMKRAYAGTDSTRYWLRLEGLSGESDFQYFVDGEIRVSDPYTEKVRSLNDEFISSDTYPGLEPYPSGETEQLVSVLQPEQADDDFAFSPFERPAQKDLVIYELLVRDFIEAHDYETMADTLDYLDRLGVTAIELMPVAEFDGNQSWGYNPNHYFAPDKYYGPEEDLKAFIEAAHQRGIAIILDVVYNHQTGQAPFVRLYNAGEFGAPTEENIWVNTVAKHPFNVFYDNNHESEATQYWLDRATRHWLTEYNVDGFRFDLSKGFTQGPNDEGYTDVGNWSSYDAERVALLKRMADQIWQVDDEAYVILEHFGSQQEEDELTRYRRDEGLPGMMVWNNLNHAYNQLSMGYQEDAGIQATYGPNKGLPVTGPVTYMESHDEQWMMYRNIAFGNASGDGEAPYDVTNFETAFNRQKLVGAFFFTVPGPRMMWQFGELGYGWGNDGIQCLKGGGGAAGECTEADVPLSQIPGRTAPKPIKWDYRSDPDRMKLYKTWSALINLRLAEDVFTSPETEVGIVSVGGDFARRITLTGPGGEQVVVLGNFDVEEAQVSIQFPSGGTWHDFFPGDELDITNPDTSFTYAPGEFHVYTSEEPPFTPEAGIVPFGSTRAAEEERFEPPVSVSTQISQTFGDPSVTANYRLVALPGQSDRRVGSGVEGEPGEAWQAYWDTGAQGDGEYLVPFGEKGFPEQYAPGRGYWMISENAREISATFPTVELGENHTYAIELHDGWNIISNPFGENVSWSDVQAVNNTNQPLWKWYHGSGRFSQESTFESAAEEGEAFYFFNDSDLEQLVLPYPGASSSPAVATSVAAGGERRTLMLTARAGEQRLGRVVAGTHSEARAGADRFDQPAPPARFAGATLRLAPPEAKGRSQAWAADFRSPGEEGYVFDLVLRGDAGRFVRLKASALEAFAGQEVRLLERASAEAHDLHASPGVTVRTDGGETRLQLLVGSAAFVEQHVEGAVPERVQLRASYPNPLEAGRRATIEYALPSSAEVRLQVFDTLGRRVKTLVDERQEAGFYTVGFHARGLASGVYFYRLTAEGRGGTFSDSGRLVLVR